MQKGGFSRAENKGKDIHWISMCCWIVANIWQVSYPTLGMKLRDYNPPKIRGKQSTNRKIGLTIIIKPFLWLQMHAREQYN